MLPYLAGEGRKGKGREGGEMHARNMIKEKMKITGRKRSHGKQLDERQWER